MWHFLLLLLFSFMSICVLSVHVRSIKNQLKRKRLFLYCQKGADFYFIQETHASEADVKLWRSQWGRNVWFSFGTNRSAGVAVLQGKFKGNIINHFPDTNGRWIILLVEVDHFQFIIINIYASNNKQNNAIIFSTIENKTSCY